MNEPTRHFIEALRCMVDTVAAEFKAKDAQLREKDVHIVELYDSIQRLETERASLERQLLKTGSGE